ncbi:MAG: 7-cyano-7-deazaguanine synthase QueC [Phycisphaerales bacterium]|nr:7-cyano-7-deazaguanine synthase QueC [Phycisphaerales bacterium]
MATGNAQFSTTGSGKPAVVLLSGGLDSTTVLAIAQEQGYDCHTIAFDYGQRHRNELDASAKISSTLGARSHRVFPIDIGAFGGSALTADIEVPKGRDESEMTDIPITYVPARNLVFLSIATALAETLDAKDIYLGVNAVDYSGYPDCRPEFIESFAATANLATKMGVESTDEAEIRVHSPLMEMTKGQIIKHGVELGVDYSMTHSCYDPIDGRACGQCDSCILRRRGFEQAGIDDPTLYASQQGAS